LIEYGGRTYGLVNQNIAGHEVATGKKSFCQLPPGSMKYFHLRPQYIALDTVSWVVFSPGASVRAWLYPGAIVTTTHLVTASSLADMLKGVSVPKSDVSEAVKLDMHARYTSPCEFRYPFFCDTTCLQDVLGQTFLSGVPPSLETPAPTKGTS
jgi:hypothetical protein